MNNELITENNLNNNIEQEINNAIELKMADWTNSEVYKVLNDGLDSGIRLLLPDEIEDKVIKIKNEIINNDVKKYVKDMVMRGINALNELQKDKINNNSLKNVNEVKEVLKSGNVIEGFSSAISKGIEKIKETVNLDKSLTDTLKTGQSVIIEKVENKIDESFENQIKKLEKMEKYISNWKSAYNNKDFNKMQREYNKMGKTMSELMPIENIINEYKTIDNLQNLIKNNDKNFDLSEEAIELANKLIN